MFDENWKGLLELDELVVVTWTYDPAPRHRYYELLVEAFELRAILCNRYSRGATQKRCLFKEAEKIDIYYVTRPRPLRFLEQVRTKLVTSNQLKHISKARRIKFEIDKIFPLGDSQSVPLLRLMMATDDVRHLQKLLLSANARVKEANEIESSILNGEILHLFKLLSGHLYEAGNAFRNLENTCSGQLDAAVYGDNERKADLSYLRQVYAKTPPGTFHYTLLKPLRDYFGFHYKETQLRDALERHTKAKDLEGNLIVVEYSGFGRYSVSDHLALSAIQQLLGATPDNLHQKFSEAMGEALKVARALFQVVDHLLFWIFKEHEDAIIEQLDGEVVVSPEFLRDKEKGE